MTIKRQGYPDITDEDMKPLGEIKIEMTPINPVRHVKQGPMPIQLPDLIVIAHTSEVRERTKTTIVGEEDD